MLLAGRLGKKLLVKGGVMAGKAVVVAAKGEALKGSAVYAANHAATIHASYVAHVAAIKSIMVGAGLVITRAVTAKNFEKLATL